MSKRLIDEATVKLVLEKIKAARDCHPNAVDTLLFEAEEILEEALAEQPAPVQQEWIETACALIKAADDAAHDSDYMLDSNDCIKVLRGQWKGSLMNDQPVAPKPAPLRPKSKQGKRHERA